MQTDVIEQYIASEDINTQFNLKDRIKSKSVHKENDIILEFDANKLTEYSMNIIQELPLIIKENDTIGKFELDIFTITIKKLEEHQTKLINKNSVHYTSTLKK